ncbi:hypothetical protein [Ensifer adhaerens]|uniref:hypothetical protein n=1 Tax=Ensifer adhaerens TaxID=106592 RepID=UPI00069F9401|nr:hypothetical protein [Ensifer adhaerens]
MLHKNGKDIQVRKSGRPPRFDYAEVISVALRSEIRDYATAIRIISNWTDASESTVINWLSGRTGPNDLYLIRLLRKSDEVLLTVLGLAQRLELLDRYYAERGMAGALMLNARPRNGGATGSLDRTVRVPVDDPDDPDRVPDGHPGLNIRQSWFIRQLRLNPEVRATHIAEFFGVSVKTGKRDIALLKRQKLVSWSGSARRGCYTPLV